MYLKSQWIYWQYLCLDHAWSLVPQVLQGSSNINLFSTCNKPQIGLSSEHKIIHAASVNLLLSGSLWASSPIENYYIHLSADLAGSCNFCLHIEKKEVGGPFTNINSREAREKQILKNVSAPRAEYILWSLRVCHGNATEHPFVTSKSGHWIKGLSHTKISAAKTRFRWPFVTCSWHPENLSLAS